MPTPAEPTRLLVSLTGAVQGVGFRPFAWRLAREMGLLGRVCNDGRGARVEVQHPEREVLDRFCERLRAELPPPGRIASLRKTWLPAAEIVDLRIVDSPLDDAEGAEILPDLVTCPTCVAEVFDPGARRHDHPFANCTACGPRFSILRRIPWERAHTAMAGFEMCPACRAEYVDPADRRYHAQPISCPACGPRLSLWTPGGETIARESEALEAAARALMAGQIVGVQGLGGFQLLVDAVQEGAVATLRLRKGRPDKPLALMVRDLETAEGLVELGEAGAAALGSPRGPIVLAPRRRPGSPAVASSVAPGLDDLGVMLPATPLHHLLLRAVDRPLVATSGNLGGEPICTAAPDAVERLSRVVDLLLVHDRPIERPVDDSVVFEARGMVRPLRVARGLAPLSLSLSSRVGAGASPVVVGLGAHLKNAVAISSRGRVVLGQHVGDLGSQLAREAHVRAVSDLLRLCGARPEVIACDLHPGYASSRHAAALAAQTGARLARVQHHHAHLAACLLDNGIEGEALGVVWDGTGLGHDGTIWGGEFLLGDARRCVRAAHLRTFGLPGGEAAIAEPARVGLALLWELLGSEVLEHVDLAPLRALGRRRAAVLVRMLERGVNAPRTSSAGRLFDGVAALLGLAGRVTWEGQAAVRLQALAGRRAGRVMSMPMAPGGGGQGPLVLDWGPVVQGVLAGLAGGEDRASLAAAFHASLARGIAEVAGKLGRGPVVLTGGCFQNRRLLEETAAVLEERGARVAMHRELPCNDGGIAAGQVAVASRR